MTPSQGRKVFTQYPKTINELRINQRPLPPQLQHLPVNPLLCVSGDNVAAAW